MSLRFPGSAWLQIGGCWGDWDLGVLFLLRVCVPGLWGCCSLFATGNEVRVFSSHFSHCFLHLSERSEWQHLLPTGWLREQRGQGEREKLKEEEMAVQRRRSRGNGRRCSWAQGHRTARGRWGAECGDKVWVLLMQERGNCSVEGMREMTGLGLRR